ncbi:hypothetical protein KUTeg_008593 [Tegillarca granosa]|uniref:DDE-1 domain-containing protein n=1 Tax=Tegillarca granosa TaxID=220873 RepID=A0ABQ9F9J9_TEGGR|nr:hypothetical protein KUTeg_008593 [Tegillarca granosa]
MKRVLFLIINLLMSLLMLITIHRLLLSKKNHLVEWAKSKDIVILILPAHTSHVSIPLDVNCYGPLEKIYNNLCYKFIRTNSSCITRYDICGLACKAYTKALVPDNLIAGFTKTGIYPLDKLACPPSSLDRITGRIDVDCVTTGRTPSLDMEEKAKLVQHISSVADLGYGYTRQEVTDLASDYALQLGKRQNPFTLNWFEGFRNRWETIRVLKPRVLFLIINLLKSLLLLITIHRLLLSKKSYVTTVIGAGSASGVAVPFFIFVGARMLPDLLKDCSPGTDGAMSSTGWSNT